MTASVDWLSIREASLLLGVHVGTVREWADSGALPSYRTPGGHRRFSRTGLQQFINRHGQVSPQTPSPSPTEQALTRVREELQGQPYKNWIASKAPSNDLERATQREFGRHLLACVVAYVKERDRRDELLDQGRQTACEYGRALAASGVSAGSAARATIRFRQLILKTVLEVTLGSRLGDEEDARLFQRVSSFLDEILLAIVEAYP